MYLSNFTNGQRVASHQTSTFFPAVAQKFRTGDNADGYIVDAVMVRVGFQAGSGEGDLVIAICSDGGSVPGSVLYTFSGAGPTNNLLTNLVFKAPAGAVLNGNSTYWLRATTTTGTNSYFWRFAESNYTDFASLDDWAFLSNGDFNQAPNSDYALMTEIRVTPGVKYFQDFSTAALGDTSFGDGSTLYSTALGSYTEVRDGDMKVLQLTTNGITAGLAPTTARSALLLPDLDPGEAIGAFSAKWNAQLIASAPGAGQGFSFNFGRLAGFTYDGSIYNQEEGYGVGLSVGVKNDGASPGFYLRINGNVAAYSAFNPTIQWGFGNPTSRFFEVDWHHTGGLTMRVDRNTIFSNVNTYGFIPQSGDRFVFAARNTLAFPLNQRFTLDDIIVATGGNLVRDQIGTPYEISEVIEQDKVFDGISTQNEGWTDFSFPGAHAGGTLGARRQIAVYAVNTFGTDQTFWPRSWEFEGRTNGATAFTSTGSATNQPFRHWSDTLVYPTTSTESYDQYRMNITANNGASGVRLGEITPYRFVPASAPNTWKKASTPLGSGVYWTGLAATYSGSRFYASAYGQGMYRSALNNPYSWTMSSNTGGTNYWRGIACSYDGIRVAVARDFTELNPGVSYSQNSGSSYSFSGSFGPINNWYDVACDGEGQVFIACSREANGQSEFYRSQNGGATWFPIPGPDKQWSSIEMSYDGQTIFAAADDLTNSLYIGQIWVSTNGSSDWTATSAPSNKWTDIAISGDGQLIFATAQGTNLIGNAGSGVYYSRDRGQTWTRSPAWEDFWFHVDCSFDGQVVIAVPQFTGDDLALSQDGGETWSMIKAPASQWGCVAISGNGETIVAGAESGLWVYEFEMLPPRIADNFSQTVHPSQATVAANVHPHGSPTAAWFVLGTNALPEDMTNVVQMGSGNSFSPASTTFSNLFPATTYYFRPYATNLTRVVRSGVIQSFDTPAAGTPGLAVAFDGAQFTAGVTGSAYTVYHLQASPGLNPADWQNIDTNNTGQLGTFDIIIAPGETTQYYRAISQ